MVSFGLVFCSEDEVDLKNWVRYAFDIVQLKVARGKHCSVGTISERWWCFLKFRDLENINIILSDRSKEKRNVRDIGQKTKDKNTR